MDEGGIAILDAVILGALDDALAGSRLVIRGEWCRDGRRGARHWLRDRFVAAKQVEGRAASRRRKDPRRVAVGELLGPETRGNRAVGC